MRKMLFSFIVMCFIITGCGNSKEEGIRLGMTKEELLEVERMPQDEIEAGDGTVILYDDIGFAGHTMDLYCWFDDDDKLYYYTYSQYTFGKSKESPDERKELAALYADLVTYMSEKYGKPSQQGELLTTGDIESALSLDEDTKIETVWDVAGHEYSVRLQKEAGRDSYFTHMLSVEVDFR